jgi:hypothetical protein
MRIIYTSEEDFLVNEINEHGHDYVEAQFALGYVPAFSGFWHWIESNRRGMELTNVLRSIQGDSSTSDIRGHDLPSNRIRVPSH